MHSVFFASKNCGTFIIIFIITSLLEGFLQCRCPAIKSSEQHVVAVASSSAQDAERVPIVMQLLMDNHHKLFLWMTFDINPDGAAITNPNLCLDKTKKHHSVKTVAQHASMICILSKWGDNDVVKDGHPEDPKVVAIRMHWKSNAKGYVYALEYHVEEVYSWDGEPYFILIHKATGGKVFHMLDIFNAIDEVHYRIGHLGQVKTIVGCKPELYSATLEIVKIYWECCYICMEKTPTIPPCKGAKKPIFLLTSPITFKLIL